MAKSYEAFMSSKLHRERNRVRKRKKERSGIEPTAKNSKITCSIFKGDAEMHYIYDISTQQLAFNQVSYLNFNSDANICDSVHLHEVWAFRIC